MQQAEPLDHLPEEWFEQYVQGTLPEDQLAIFEERLLVDESVQRRLDETEVYLKAMKAALRRAQTELADDQPGFLTRLKQWITLPAPVMGGIAVAAAALVVFVAVQRPQAPQSLPPAHSVDLHALRGGSEEASAASGHVRFRLDLTGVRASQADSVEVLTDNGNSVWKAPLHATGEWAMVDVPLLLAAGQYLIRVNHGQEQIREFAVVLK